MKKTTYIIIFLLLVTSVNAASTAYYNFNDQMLDQWGSIDGTVSGLAYTTDYPIYNQTGNGTTKAGNFGVADQVTFTPWFNGTGNFSISIWFKLNTVSSQHTLFTKNGGTSGTRILIYFDATGNIIFLGNDGSTRDMRTTNDYDDNTWHHLVVTRNASAAFTDAGRIYIDGSLAAVDHNEYAVGDVVDANGHLIGNSRAGGNDFIGQSDELKFWNHLLVIGNVTNLYNCGNATSCGTTPGNASTWGLYVNNLYNDTDLSGVNVTFDAGCWNLTDATGFAQVTNNTAGCSGLSNPETATIQLSGLIPNASSYSIPENSTANAGMYKKLVDVMNVTELVTGNLVSTPYNITTGGNKTYENGTTMYVLNGTDTYTFSKTGWYNRTNNISIPDIGGPFNETFTGAYNALIHVNASNAYTGVAITNFTLNVSNNTHAYTESYNTITGDVYVQSIQGVSLFMLIDAPGYAYTNHTLNSTNSTPHYEFKIYSNNSILINIFDENTGVRITDNITIIVTGNASENTYWTVTGTYFLQNLTDGNYSIKFQGTNYTLKTYQVTVADRSTQVLNAFLSSSTNTVIFAIFDQVTNAAVPDVSIGMYRLINSTLTLVESKFSDITGRAQFTYTNGVKYSFVMSKAEYNTLSFSLDPVLFSSYNIFMVPLVVETQEYADVTHFYTPNLFQNNATNNFTFAINSPSGILTNYNLTLSWPGGSQTFTGNNANGGSFTHSFNITGAEILDTVNVTYTYQTVFGQTKTYTYLNGILGGATDTIIGNRNETYGMGLFERILFATVITMIIAGLATLFSNSLFGLFLGMLAQGIFMFIGFIPLMMFLLTATIGVMIMARRAGD